MELIRISCTFCGKKIFRGRGRVNEAKKFGWHQFCSPKCLSLDRNKQKTFKCGNPTCHKIIKRSPCEIPLSGICFCSKHCAAIINNSKRSRQREIKICPVCGKQFYGRRKYCSKVCCPKPPGLPLGVQEITEEQIINQIKEFYKNHGRIPVKREFRRYDTARVLFGTWNKAIEVAGFEPNPVLFVKKHIAKDGHQCDSFAEKIIDDWLFCQNIPHKRNVPYPKNSSLTADFAIKNYIVEFFGLFGDIREYDELVKRKKKICQKHKLKLIEIYPKDLYPINKLGSILKDFI